MSARSAKRAPYREQSDVGIIRSQFQSVSLLTRVIAGLVPAISTQSAQHCHDDRDDRDVGERSDAVLRTAMPGHDG
jgi:hypothetical protein